MVNQNIEKCEAVKYVKHEEIKESAKKALDQDLLETDNFIVSTYTNFVYPLHSRKLDQLETQYFEDDSFYVLCKPIEIDELMR